MINLMSFLKRYFIIYAVFTFGMVLFLRLHKQANYSTEKLTQIMTAQSRFKGQTDDPCLYSIVGEPSTPGQYLKLTFKCPGKEARFSLDFAAIRERTVGGAIRELFRVNGVTLDPAKLSCKQGGRGVKLDDAIVAQDNIECSL